MVRINRTYTIDVENVDNLKDIDNASELVNQLLYNHFNKSNSKDIQKLTSQLNDMDDELDMMRRKRDKIADRIREVEDDKRINEEEKEKIEKEKEYKNGLGKWLSDKVKTKEDSPKS